MCLLLLSPPSMPHNEAGRISQRALFTGVRGRVVLGTWGVGFYGRFGAARTGPWVMCRRPSRAIMPRDRPRQEARGGGEMIRVLLVDDRADIRRAMASLMDGQPDIEVVAQAGSLAEARGKLGGIDVALLDRGLPDGTGWSSWARFGRRTQAP